MILICSCQEHISTNNNGKLTVTSHTLAVMRSETVAVHMVIHCGLTQPQTSHEPTITGAEKTCPLFTLPHAFKYLSQEFTL